MAIQGKKIDVAGPLNAATAEGMLASASQIHVDANNDSLDKAVIGDITLDEAINMDANTASQIINGALPTYYRIKDANLITGTCQFFIERNNFSIVQIIYTNYFISPEEITRSTVYRTYKRTGNLLLAEQNLPIWGSWSIIADENDKQAVTNISENLGVEEYPLFSTTDAYIVGKVVRYTDGRLYRFKTAHAAGAWNTSEVEPWNIVRDWRDNHARILDCGNADTNSKIIFNQNIYNNSKLQEGYYHFGNLGVGDIAPSNSFNSPSGQNWGCIVIPVIKGEVIEIKAKGGLNGRTYALTNNDRKILILADANLDTILNPVILSVESDGYLYINQIDISNTEFNVVVKQSIVVQVQNLQTRVNELEEHPITSVVAPKMYNPILNLQKEKLRILDIGNSYTADATHYLPELVTASGIDVSNICLYTAQRGGASFKTWFDTYHDKDNKTYAIGKCFGELTANITGTADIGNGEKFRNTLINNEWDLIIIHQVSNYAPYFDKWEENSDSGYLSKFIRLLRKHQPKATIGFLLVHSYWSNYNNNTEKSSLERWKLIAESIKKLRANYGIDFIIPYGTAIQNLRASSLNNEYDLTADGTHCANGIADYTASCTYFQSLLSPRYGVSVLGNTARINVEQTETYPSSDISVTNENAPTCQKAAFLATYNWYECINPDNIDDEDLI